MSQPTPMCRYLRAKTRRGAHGDVQALEEMATDPTAVFWCVLTMSAAGVDDGLVHAQSCRAGRSCCTPHEEPFQAV